MCFFGVFFVTDALFGLTNLMKMLRYIMNGLNSLRFAGIGEAAAFKVEVMLSNSEAFIKVTRQKEGDEIWANGETSSGRD